MECLTSAATRERPDVESQQCDPLTKSAERRLAVLLKLNSEYQSGCADLNFLPGEAANNESVFSFLGFSLGLLPPAALFLKFIITAAENGNAEASVIVLLTLVVAVGTCVGYFSGRTIGKIVRKLEAVSWGAMLAITPFVGLVWGMIAGAAAGAVIFLIGAIPGAIVGGAVGAAALPLFSILHRSLKKGDQMAFRHLYPTTLGIAALIAAFLL